MDDDGERQEEVVVKTDESHGEDVDMEVEETGGNDGAQAKDPPDSDRACGSVASSTRDDAVAKAGGDDINHELVSKCSIGYQQVLGTGAWWVAKRGRLERCGRRQR